MKWIARIISWSPALFLLLAIYLIHRQLQNVDFKQLHEELRNWHPHRIVIGLALVFANFAMLTGYDLTGLRELGAKTSLRTREGSISLVKAFRTAFASYSISNVVGHALVTGSSVRIRSYVREGISIATVTRLSLLNVIGYWLGFLFVTGLSLCLIPIDDQILTYAPILGKGVGVALLGVVAIYLLLCTIFSGRGITIFRRIHFTVPRFRTSFTYLLLSGFEVVVCGAVLYVLLPQSIHIPFMEFIGFYLIAQMIGVLSQVPGGLGVLDGILLKLLAPYGNVHQVFVSIILFRGIYYFLPLLLTVAYVLLDTIWSGRKHLRFSKKFRDKRISPFISQASGVVVFLCGTVLLLAGSTPSDAARMQSLEIFFPLAFIDVFHALNSLFGLSLLILSREVWKKNIVAFQIVLTIMGFASLTSILKGFDVEIAGVMIFMLIVLFNLRENFHRRASLFNEKSLSNFDLAILAVLVFVTSLGLSAFRHLPHAGMVWFDIDTSFEAQRFLRGTAVLFITLSVFMVSKYLYILTRSKEAVSDEHNDNLEKLVSLIADVVARRALMSDKHLRFSRDGRAFLMFGICEGSWVVLGDVFGEPASAKQLLESFLEEVDREGVEPIFYLCSDGFVTQLIDANLIAFKMGDESWIDLQSLDWSAPFAASARSSRENGDQRGWSFEVVANPTAQFLSELRAAQSGWQTNKRVPYREPAFAKGSFEESYLERLPVAVVRSSGKVAAFAALINAGQIEASLDVVRAPRSRRTTPAEVDYLLAKSLDWARSQGFKRFNLGLAPIADAAASPWSKFWFELAEAELGFAGERRSRYVAYDSGRSPSHALRKAAKLNRDPGSEGLFP